MGWAVKATPLLLNPRERDPIPIVKEAGGASRLVWRGAQNLTSPMEFEPWVARPVASHCIDRAILPFIYTETALTCPK